MIFLLNLHTRAQNQSLSALEERNKEIIEIISINSQSEIEGDSQDREFRERQEVTATKRHQEVLAAILTARDGSSKTLTGSNYSDEYTCSMSRAGTIRTTTTYTQSESEGIRVSSNDPHKAFKPILDKLHYRTIAQRQASIRAAHAKTFQWIRADPSSKDKPWHSLKDWLAEGKGCYWISGKAGSGKSTPMKYVQNHETFQELLHIWKGASQLIIASFYFWFAGNSLQKSQIGLLRSLLLVILSERQELIPIVFPHLCRCILSSQVKPGIEFDFTELSEGFLNLLRSMPVNLKVCLVIDGIDEYEGDHREICEFISKISDFESVKILLSSRPIPACVQYFSSYPKLHLQDLTRGDIVRYVQDKLVGHPTLRKLNQFEKGATEMIVNNLTSKAAGVLLWVVFVVNRLLVGLQEYDVTSDLMKKIDELPPDLETLYEHMLGSMGRVHRCQGSKLLQIVLWSTQIQGNHPMTLLQLSFAEETEDYKRLIREPRSSLDDQEEEWRCEAMEGRMRSRCCGLIEAQELSTPDDVAKPKVVGFLHRTVVEFLQDGEVWSLITNLTAGTKFDACSAVLCSCLQELRVRPSEYGTGKYPSFDSFVRLVVYTKDLKNHIQRDVMDECLCSALETMRIHWHNPDLFPSPQIESQAVTGAINRGMKLTESTDAVRILLSAAIHCPPQHLAILIKILRDQVIADQMAAIMLLLFVGEAYAPLNIAMARNILGFGQSINEPLTVPTPMKSSWCQRWEGATTNGFENSWSLWEFMLHFLHSISSQRNVDSIILTATPEAILDLIFNFVKEGADVSQRISLNKPTANKRHTTYQYSALAVVHDFLSAIWTARILKKQNSSGAISSLSDTAPSKAVFAAKAVSLEWEMESKGAKSGTRPLQPQKKPPNRLLKIYGDQLSASPSIANLNQRLLISNG